MERRWILIYDNYNGLEKTAIDMLSGVISGYLNYVLPIKNIKEITDDKIKNSNLLWIGKIKNNHLLSFLNKNGLIEVPNKAEGYGIFVGESPWEKDKQIIAIAGFDSRGVLYGCMDFCNRYCGDILYRTGYLCGKTFFENRFDEKLTEWKISTAPMIKTRAIWTWGHVIYDYREFFRNMVRIRLNEIVIWNDVAPINAKEVVEYAHSLGIKVIWGFAWGWGTSCTQILEEFNEETAQKIKESVLKKYEEEYSLIGGDGIIFNLLLNLIKIAWQGNALQRS